MKRPLVGKEPALVTSYSLLSLEMLWRGLAD